MGKIRAGLAAAGGVMMVAEWLVLSHSVRWLLAAVLPY